MAEPVTVLTDYVLAAVATWFGVGLLREPVVSRRLWGGAMVLTAVAALLGGTEHGLRPYLSGPSRFWIWEGTYLAIGGANALLLAGAARVAWPARWRRVAIVLILARLGVFVVVVTLDQHFRHVVRDFALTLLVLSVFATWGARRRLPWPAWLAGAIVLSLAGAAVQGLRLAPHEHFNHNDLFHVLQAAGVVFFSRAGRLLADKG